MGCEASAAYGASDHFGQACQYWAAVALQPAGGEFILWPCRHMQPVRSSHQGGILWWPVVASLHQLTWSLPCTPCLNQSQLISSIGCSCTWSGCCIHPRVDEAAAPWSAKACAVVSWDCCSNGRHKSSRDWCSAVAANGVKCHERLSRSCQRGDPAAARLSRPPLCGLGSSLPHTTGG